MTVHGKISSGFIASIILSPVAACGLYTPDKDAFTSDAPVAPDYKFTRQGSYESGVVDHITCEISQGLAQAESKYNSGFLPRVYKDWGTAVTLTVTVEDQTGLSPGISFLQPLNNVLFPFPTGGTVVNPQSFSFSVGGTASVNGLRTETIQYTVKNKDAIAYSNCGNVGDGILMDGDLKIREFIFDKVQIMAAGNGLWDKENPPYNTWTEEITFVSSYGGTATPTWHLARISANTSANLVIAQRTNTNDLIITLGPLDPCQQTPPPTSTKPKPGCPFGVEKAPLELTAAAMNQHNARVQANAIATSISGQTH